MAGCFQRAPWPILVRVSMPLKKNRAAEIKRVLIDRLKVEGPRLETIGRGWEEPSGADAEQNRRVEAQWFTIE